MSSVVLKSLPSIFIKRHVCNSLNKPARIQFSSAKLFSEESPEDAAKAKKKTTPIPKITLLSSDNSMMVTTLEEAQKISRRRDLKLVKVSDLDTKTQRPVYKLMTSTDLAEDLRKREEKKKSQASDAVKGEKLLFVNCGISEHDLNIQVKKILKWVEKKFEIRVVISGDTNDKSKVEKVYKYLESNVGSNARFLQKRMTSTDIKFQIIPPKRDKNKDGKNE